MQITRYQMYKKVFAALPLPLEGKILGVSGLKYWIGSKNYKPPFPVIAQRADVIVTQYPEVTMSNLPYADASFDYVICDQVLEHIEGDVQKAVDEGFRVLKSGGILIIATVFMHPIHYGPKDLWRFSADALTYLCRNFSQIVTCESWGNRWVHVLFLLYDRARDWQVPERKMSIMHFLATYNEPRLAHSSWIVAKK